MAKFWFSQYFTGPSPTFFGKNTSKQDKVWLVPQEKNEKIEQKKVRFRTLGCYPLTAAVESDATTVEEIIIELLESKYSERQGRLIDNDQIGSMEKKKQEGYF